MQRIICFVRDRKVPLWTLLISFALGLIIGAVAYFGISSAIEYNDISQNVAVQTTPSPAESKRVYYTPNGKKYHRKDCSTLFNSSVIESGTEDIVSETRSPCKVCEP